MLPWLDSAGACDDVRVEAVFELELAAELLLTGAEDDIEASADEVEGVCLEVDSVLLSEPIPPTPTAVPLEEAIGVVV